MNLTVIIATRGRPEILRGTLEHLVRNCELDSTRILVAIDSDDLATVHQIGSFPRHDRVIYSVRQREDTRGLKYDRALTEAPADLYLVGVDHTPILTKGYDRMFVEATGLFPDGIGCVCTPMANASFPYLQAPTARLVEIMGYVQPHDFPFWFVDHWLDDVARMIGRYVMVDVECDSSRRPATTTVLRDVAFWADYFDARVTKRREQANRAIELMDEPEWRKAMLRANFPMVEFRSKWVNDIVRAQAVQIEAIRGTGEPPDERYLRAKARAELILRVTQ